MLCRSLHKTKAVIVMCRSSAPDYSRQRASAFFDFNHNNGPASFCPTEFFGAKATGGVRQPPDAASIEN